METKAVKFCEASYQGESGLYGRRGRTILPIASKQNRPTFFAKSFGTFTAKVQKKIYLLTNNTALGMFLPGPALYPPDQRAVEPPLSRLRAFSIPNALSAWGISATVAL